MENWGLTNIKLKLKFAELEFKPNAEDEEAAWNMYVEMITRVTTQNLSLEYGDEKSSLDSIYKIFDITRNILKQHGRKCNEFTRIAIIVLNQIIRPFTAKWHKLSLDGSFSDKERCIEYRNDLSYIQVKLIYYTKLLANIANVEDLTCFDDATYLDI
nr:hypothetical protein [Clostridium beijerinckii]